MNNNKDKTVLTRKRKTNIFAQLGLNFLKIK